MVITVEALNDLQSAADFDSVRVWNDNATEVRSLKHFLQYSPKHDIPAAYRCTGEHQLNQLIAVTQHCIVLFTDECHRCIELPIVFG